MDSEDESDTGAEISASDRGDLDTDFLSSLMLAGTEGDVLGGELPATGRADACEELPLSTSKEAARELEVSVSFVSEEVLDGGTGSLPDERPSLLAVICRLGSSLRLLSLTMSFREPFKLPELISEIPL
jgi:hypothetical protein